MKKKFLMGLMLGLLILTFGTANSKKTEAAAWGAKEVFTTPKVTRGTWYYKEGHKIKKWRITAHTSDGRKLYKVLPEKEYDRWWNKLMHLSTKKSIKATNHLDNTQWQAYTFKFHGITSFNTNGWLAGAGDGVYCVPVNKYRYGKKVKALRFGGGAGNWVMFYAYKSRSLAM
ncbi:hypothetical protein [Lactobacillus helveticus]|uniref:hypothetical protein n=1 Tax=Lactobacillus helveticus TaxID=1587 RepID=UPI001562A648|nr:hypothetical protein [Lactobacillus helveticus]NRN90341.1 hypothetical protein [Lactobacillus helveticus]NRO55506.1 hypothetical protein [Lactobacillus helveticus]